MSLPLGMASIFPNNKGVLRCPVLIGVRMNKQLLLRFKYSSQSKVNTKIQDVNNNNASCYVITNKELITK